MQVKISQRCLGARTKRTALWSVQRILGGRLRVKWAGGFTSMGTAKYSDLSGTHPGVWGWLCFYLHMEFWWLTHSLSRPALQRSAGLPWGLGFVQTHAEKSGPAWGSRAGTAEAQGLLCSPRTKQPGGQSSRQHPQSPRLRGGFQ